MGRWISSGSCTIASIHRPAVASSRGQSAMPLAVAAGSPVRHTSQGGRPRRRSTSVSSAAVGGWSRYDRNRYGTPASSRASRAPAHFEHDEFVHISMPVIFAGVFAIRGGR